MEEWKIGEIRQVNGEWYQCIEHKGCYSCAFALRRGFGFECVFKGTPRCTCRSDGKLVIFKKLEKVGEPFSDEHFGLVQKYELKMYGYSTKDKRVCFADGYDVFIKIKQNKEDMEEKKLKLKPFDIQKAREGKPVCTRGGHKARIICFDSKNDPQRPIVALVEHNDNELLYEYTIEGKDRFSHISTTGTSDLMMLPEKKEGYVNIYRSQIYDTLERAKEAYKRTCNNDNYLQTIKIEWEE